MQFAHALRRVFTSVSVKKSANDNSEIPAEKLARALQPPHDETQETLHGIVVKDPFRPLEKLDAAETAAWTARENKAFENFISPSKPAGKEAYAFLKNSFPKGMRESMPQQYGDKYIFQRKGENDQRWVYFVKDVPDYGAPARPLLDALQIDPSGKTKIAGAYFTRDAKTVAYALSVSGSDETTLKFMDVETGKDTGLEYPKFRGGITWDRDGGGFHYNRPVKEGSKTSALCYHRMGAPVKDDKVIYTPENKESGAHYFRILKDSKDEPGSYEWISLSGTDRDKNALLARPIGSNEKFREIFPFKEGTLSPIHQIGDKIYAVTSLGAPNEKLVCFDMNDPSPEKWQTILPENKEDPLTGVIVWQDKLFASYSHDTGEIMKVYDLKGAYLYDVPLPPLSTFTMSGYKMEDTTCLITVDNFQESGNIYKYDSATNKMNLHKKSATPIDLKDCIVERIQATSKDGTKVPMTVIRHPDTKLDGTAATLLYGYGGFNVSLDPTFSSSIAQWVRAGGLYVQANLRGGGEFGQAWYEGGSKDKKQNVFDDFIACAKHLIKNNYTSSKRLAIQGGSNGGLLTLATVLQAPKLFGAIISEVPVADMFRFHIGSYYGYSWKSDYGDPDIKRDFNIAAKYSPLHNVKKGFKHPPILIKTDANDDRVLPWHSYKMAATLQSKEDPQSLTLLKIRTDGGHSAGMTEQQWCEDVADARAFLTRTLGPINQQAYKATLSRRQKLSGALRKFGH